MGTESVVIAGFGGQGVLFAGLVLAHAAMRVGREVAWIPSYGPEMRGGTAGCTVIVSDEEIGSPIVSHPSAVVALNEPSLVKWMPRVQPGGVLVVNRSLAHSPVSRADLTVVEIPVTEAARALGDERTGNVLALGALLQVFPLLPVGAVEAAIAETLGPDKQAFLAPNLAALRRGAALALSSRSAAPLAVA
jgi:2-oxoglutarate ferredoxin oxidoreductase subunit gamma